MKFFGMSSTEKKSSKKSKSSRKHRKKDVDRKSSKTNTPGMHAKCWNAEDLLYGSPIHRERRRRKRRV